mmetsp:Transcript_50975/g.122643  ORF Transcript_50975/g.122643 Transcript_50975/m.122643 type:complete len:212 (-) Transcript_50975:13-648(-)
MVADRSPIAPGQRLERETKEKKACCARYFAKTLSLSCVCRNGIHKAATSGKPLLGLGGRRWRVVCVCVAKERQGVTTKKREEDGHRLPPSARFLLLIHPAIIFSFALAKVPTSGRSPSNPRGARNLVLPETCYSASAAATPPGTPGRAAAGYATRACRPRPYPSHTDRRGTLRGGAAAAFRRLSRATRTDFRKYCAATFRSGAGPPPTRRG